MSPTLFFQNSFSLAWNSPIRLHWQSSKPQKSPCLRLPSTGISSVYHLIWLCLFVFNMGCGDQSRHTLCAVLLLWTELSPQPLPLSVEALWNQEQNPPFPLSGSHQACPCSDATILSTDTLFSVWNCNEQQRLVLRNKDSLHKRQKVSQSLQHHPINVRLFEDLAAIWLILISHSETSSWASPLWWDF